MKKTEEKGNAEVAKKEVRMKEGNNRREVRKTRDSGMKQGKWKGEIACQRRRHEARKEHKRNRQNNGREWEVTKRDRNVKQTKKTRRNETWGTGRNR